MKSRYQGDGLLKTLTRLMGATYIDRYEYDIAIRSLPSQEQIEVIERNIDRLNSTVDVIDVNINKIEESVIDLTKEVHSIDDKISTKADNSEVKKLEEKLQAYATIEKVQRIDNRFVKYARNEFVYDIRNKVDTLAQNIELLASNSFVNEKVEELSKEVYSELTKYSTKSNVDELFEANNTRFDEVKRQIGEQLIKIFNTNEILKNVSEQGKK